MGPPTGGPRSAFDEHGWYLDLPGHRECIEYALETCPYLAMPVYSKRVDIADPSKLPQNVGPLLLLDETVIADRPQVFVATASDGVEVLENALPLLPYVRPVKPLLNWTYWRHGRRLSEAEAHPWLLAALGKGWKPPARRE